MDDLVALIREAAAAAADHQERFAAEDTEARKIVDIMEHFLRTTGRVVYGGAAINAHMSPANKFYDPNLYLPDYDFLTPDPLQDCADLIVAFQAEGFDDVEAKFGIHEGTYKIFVNYRAAADITYMPDSLYERLVVDAEPIDGIRYASPNYLRMNMYLELSRPQGDVSRWEKVYKRLLLLNAEKPLRPGRCVADPLRSLSESKDNSLHERIVDIGITSTAIFISGASYLVDKDSEQSGPVLMMSNRYNDLAHDLVSLGLKATRHDAIGELLPARVELRTRKGSLAAVVFDTVACHNYTVLKEPAGYRLGSIDLLIQMYYALYFAGLDNYLNTRPLCVIAALIELEATHRRKAIKQKEPATTVFPMDCVGHQPTLPELKKAHRERVREKRAELETVLKLQDSGAVRFTRKQKQRGGTRRRLRERHGARGL
jgi:hypothetical protein